MVLLGALPPSASGPLPPIGAPATAGQQLPPVAVRSTSAGAKPTKSIGPRVQELAQHLSTGPPVKAKAACSELAMLASGSVSACMAVAEAKMEPTLSKVLLKYDDPATQCWAMSILSNCAMNKASRERQSVAVPALCKLITSKYPEVQHAAALHLATLSRSDVLTLAISGNNKSMRTLYDIEQKKSVTLAGPGCQSLQQEASHYARWALRTAQGRHYKPAYVPKSQAQLDYEATVAIQARVRSSFMANSYRNEMKARRAAATIVQAGYRGHTGRSAVAQQIMVEAPAAALLQGVMRGRKHRKKMEHAKQEGAATKVQAMTRGRKSRQQHRQRAAAMASSAGSAPVVGDGPADADDMADDEALVLDVFCSDGKVSVSMALPFADFEEEYRLGFRIDCVDGPAYVSFGIPILDGEEDEEDEAIEPMMLFVKTSEGDMRVRLNIE